MLIDQILYVGSDVFDINGKPLLIRNNIYNIEEPWDCSYNNPIMNTTLDRRWIFFIYDESGSTEPKGYELDVQYIKHPRERIIQNIIES